MFSWWLHEAFIVTSTTGSYIFTRRIGLSVAIIIVTAAAHRFLIESFFRVAVGTFGLRVRFIKLQANSRMLKGLLIPTAMTGNTVGVHSGNPFSGRMAGAALQFGMIGVQRPAGGGMHERSLFLGIMALFASVLGVAAGTDGVHFFLSFGQFDRFLQIVTGAAIFLVMAIDTLQREHVGMLLMEKGHNRQLFIICEIDFFGRFGHPRVRQADNIGRVRLRFFDIPALQRHMADFTVGVMAPFAMTGNALTMVGTLQSGLTQIAGIGIVAVTIAAR